MFNSKKNKSETDINRVKIQLLNNLYQLIEWEDNSTLTQRFKILNSMITASRSKIYVICDNEDQIADMIISLKDYKHNVPLFYIDKEVEYVGDHTNIEEGALLHA